jgi:hypothetical protein
LRLEQIELRHARLERWVFAHQTRVYTTPPELGQIMDTKDDAADALFASTLLAIMSRVKAPEDLATAYAGLKQLESQVRAVDRASKELEPEEEERLLPSSPGLTGDDPDEPVRLIKLNDQVILKAGGQEVVAEVVLASENGRSLMLSFEATIFGIAGKMAVLQEDSGNWISVFGHHPVEVAWRPKGS